MGSEIARLFRSLYGVFVFFSVRKRSDCRGGFGTVSARLRESKAQWPTFRAACVYVYEWTSVHADPCQCVCMCAPRGLSLSLAHCVYVCVCMCTYICRENVSTVAGFKTFLRDRHLCFCGISPGSSPARMLKAQLSRGVWAPTVTFLGIILSSMSVVAWQLEARRQLAVIDADIPPIWLTNREMLYLP